MPNTPRFIFKTAPPRKGHHRPTPADTSGDLFFTNAQLPEFDARRFNFPQPATFNFGNAPPSKDAMVLFGNTQSWKTGRTFFKFPQTSNVTAGHLGNARPQMQQASASGHTQPSASSEEVLGNACPATSHESVSNLQSPSQKRSLLVCAIASAPKRRLCNNAQGRGIFYNENTSRLSGEVLGSTNNAPHPGSLFASGAMASESGSFFGNGDRRAHSAELFKLSTTSISGAFSDVTVRSTQPEGLFHPGTNVSAESLPSHSSLTTNTPPSGDTITASTVSSLTEEKPDHSARTDLHEHFDFLNVDT